MADKELLEILLQGSEAWNRYRKDNPDIAPDFSGANLSKANLSATNLKNANFSDSNLSGALLIEANLRRSNLSGASLRRANLSSADFSEADLSNAGLNMTNLTGAVLVGTTLVNARFGSANLTGTDFSKANLNSAYLNEADLTTAKLYAADLSGAKLTGVDLRDADFTDAIITNTNFTGAFGFSSAKGLSTAKGIVTAKGLEGLKIISPELNVKQTEVDLSQQIPSEEFRQQISPDIEVPNSGDNSKFTPKTEGSDSEQEKGGWGEKWGDSWGGEPPPEIDPTKDKSNLTENLSEEITVNDVPTVEVDPAREPKVWLTAWSPTAHPDQHYIDLDASGNFVWEVPLAALPGDHIIFYVTEGTGLLYICILSEINSKRSKTVKEINYAKLSVKYRLENSIPLKELKADAVLKDWHLVKINMRNAARSQTRDITSQPDLWTALKNLIIKYNPESSAFFPDISRRKLPVKLQESLLSDERATVDALGHKNIVTVLAAFLTTRKTKFPLSIAVDAPWGTGKSTVMYLLQNKLQHKDQNLLNELTEKGQGEDKYIELLEDRTRASAVQSALAFTWGGLRKTLRSVTSDCEHISENGSGNKKPKPLKGSHERAGQERVFETISFNAWRHGSGDRLSASMVSHVVNTVASRLDPIDREKFWFGLNLRRLDIDSLRRKTFFKLFTASLTGILSLIALIIFLLVLPLLNEIFLPQRIENFLYLDAGGTLAALGALIYSIRKNVKKTVSFDLSEHFRSPNYQELMGPQDEIEKDFHHTINYLKVQGKSLAVFVDDLDRCSPNQVVEVVESINIFFGQQCKDCVFIIGMHRDLVATSLELGYEKLVAKVKAAPHLSEELPFGQRFLEKIVQFVVRLPEPGVDDIDDFLDKIVGANLAHTETSPNKLVKIINETLNIGEQTHAINALQKDTDRDKGEADAKLALEIASRYSERTKEVKEVFKLLRETLRSNPRQYVRFFNALRFDYYLSAAERLEEPGMEDLLIMAKWVVISLEWPVLANLILPMRGEFNTILRRGSKSIITKSLIRNLVKKLIDVRSEKGKPFLKKMMEVISDERMTKLLDVKITTEITKAP